GHPPWVSLTLALSFGLYGLLRKVVHAGAVTGLTIETALLAPLAVAYLVGCKATGQLSFLAGSPGRDVLLVLARPGTAPPPAPRPAAASLHRGGPPPEPVDARPAAVPLADPAAAGGRLAVW